MISDKIILYHKYNARNFYFQIANINFSSVLEPFLQELGLWIVVSNSGVT